MSAIRDLDWWRANGENVQDHGPYLHVGCPSCGSRDNLVVGPKVHHDGHALLDCKGGCAYEDIVSALVDPASVQPTPRVVRRKSTATGDPMAWWVEHTGVAEDVWQSSGVVSDGSAVAFTFDGIDARKLRRPPTPDDPKGISWSGRLRPILWPLPPLKVGEEVHLTVSESDCGALLACGLEAYALTKGDRGVAELFRALGTLRKRGARTIVAWTDADESGRAAREAIVDAAQAAGLNVAYPDTDALADPLTGEKDVNDVFRRLGADALVEAAKAALVDVPEPARTLTHDEMLDAAEAEVEYDITDLVSPGEKVIVAGHPKSRKTWLATHLVGCLALGKPFMGHSAWSVPTPRRVMYVGEEGVRQKFGRRVRRAGIPRGSHMAAWKHRTQFRLNSPPRVSALVEELRAGAFDVLILDPFQRMAGGLEENSAKEMGQVWDAVAEIQAALPRLTVWIVFHTRKDSDLTLDDIRGSGRHAGELDVAFLIRKEDELHSTVVVEGRDLPPVQDAGSALRVRFDITDDSLDVSIVGSAQVRVVRVKAADREEQVLAAIEAAGLEGVAMEDIRVEGMTARTLRTHVQSLKDSARIVALNKPTRGVRVRYVAASGDGITATATRATPEVVATMDSESRDDHSHRVTARKSDGSGSDGSDRGDAAEPRMTGERSEGARS